MVVQVTGFCQFAYPVVKALDTRAAFYCCNALRTGSFILIQCLHIELVLMPDWWAPLKPAFPVRAPKHLLNIHFCFFYGMRIEYSGYHFLFSEQAVPQPRRKSGNRLVFTSALIEVTFV